MDAQWVSPSQARRCEEEEEEEEGHRRRQATEVSLWAVIAAMQGVERKVDVHAGRLLTLERRMGLAEKKLSGTEKAMAEFGHPLATLGTLVQEYGQLQRRLENMENLLKNRNFWILRLPPGSEGETPKLPECFDEVSVYFSKQRWENPEGGQKELCEEEEEEDVGKGKEESLASMESPASRHDSMASISQERAPSLVGEWSSEERKAPVAYCPGPEAVGMRSVLLEAPDPEVLCFPEEGLACADERSVGTGHGLEPPAKRGRGFGDFTTIILQEGALPGEAPYVCPECGKSFLYEEQRALHQETHPRPSSEPQGSPPPALQPVATAYPCPECGRCFPHQLGLSKHRLWHSGERPKHTCAECKKSFRLKINLRLHQQSHAARARTAAGAKPGSYTCSQCGRGFNHHSNFLRHQMIHTGERPYACGECGKTFIRKEHLATHGRLHTGERPYRCLLCQKTFTRKQHLVGHQRLHQGQAGGLESHLPKKRPSGGPSKTPTVGQDDELEGGGQAAFL